MKVKVTSRIASGGRLGEELTSLVDRIGSGGALKKNTPASQLAFSGLAGAAISELC